MVSMVLSQLLCTSNSISKKQVPWVLSLTVYHEVYSDALYTCLGEVEWFHHRNKGQLVIFLYRKPVWPTLSTGHAEDVEGLSTIQCTRQFLGI